MTPTLPLLCLALAAPSPTAPPARGPLTAPAVRVARSFDDADKALDKAAEDVRQKLDALDFAGAVQVQTAALKKWGKAAELSESRSRRAQKLLAAVRSLASLHPAAQRGDLDAARGIARMAGSAKNLGTHSPKGLRAEALRLLRANDAAFARAFDAALPKAFALHLKGASAADTAALNRGLLAGAAAEFASWGIKTGGQTVVEGTATFKKIPKKNQAALLRHAAMKPFYLVLDTRWTGDDGAAAVTATGEINFLALDRAHALQGKTVGSQWMDKWLTHQLEAADGRVDHPHLRKAGDNEEMLRLQNAFGRGGRTR